MKVLRAMLAGSLLVLPALVAAQSVQTDFDKSYDFSTVKTYSIRIGTAWGNDLAQRRVLAEFDEAIASKGWTKAPQDEAQIDVILHGATAVKHNINTFYNGGGFGYGYGFGGWGPGMTSTTVTDYTVGTLVVDMFDTTTKHLVFRGSASDELSDKADKNMKKVEKASAKMFKNFPPGPTQR
jgi:hypothetical protein